MITTAPRALGLALLLSMTGCLSIQQKQEFETRLQSWKGQPLDAVHLRGMVLKSVEPLLGIGHRHTFERVRQGSDQTTYHTYRDPVTGQTAEVLSAGNRPEWANNGAHNIQEGVSVHTINTNLYCRIILDTNASGVIVGIRYEGNDCW